MLEGRGGRKVAGEAQSVHRSALDAACGVAPWLGQVLGFLMLVAELSAEAVRAAH